MTSSTPGKSSSCLSRLAIWLSLISIAIGVNHYLQSPVRDVVSTSPPAAVAQYNSLPVDELVTTHNAPNSTSEPVTVEVTYRSPTEEGTIVITAPGDQAHEIALHIGQDTGLDVYVQPTPAHDQQTSGSGGDTAELLVKPIAEVAVAVLSVTAALISLRAAQLQAQKKGQALQVDLSWDLSGALGTNTLIETFIIPPDLMEDVMVAMRTGLDNGWQLKTSCRSITPP